MKSLVAKLKAQLDSATFDEVMALLPWYREVDEVRLEQARRQGRVEREGADKLKKEGK